MRFIFINLFLWFVFEANAFTYMGVSLCEKSNPPSIIKNIKKFNVDEIAVKSYGYRELEEVINFKILINGVQSKSSVRIISSKILSLTFEITEENQLNFLEKTFGKSIYSEKFISSFEEVDMKIYESKEDVKIFYGINNKGTQSKFFQIECKKLMEEYFSKPKK